jgi:SAM-dependent methyltransferase
VVRELSRGTGLLTALVSQDMDVQVPLPPVRIRQGGGRLRFDDEYFLRSAVQSAELLTSVGLSQGSRILDFGCGPGRLAIGLIAAGWRGSYLGVDVKDPQIKWAKAQITTRFPNFRFIRVDAANARYNPQGSEAHKLPVEDEAVDFICALSVFSHMLSNDTATYLGEFHRALSSGGRAYVTAFVEDGVPDETENPDWLGEWEGELHSVLYSTTHMMRLLEQAGLVLDEFLDDGLLLDSDVRQGKLAQSGLLLSRPGHGAKNLESTVKS